MKRNDTSKSTSKDLCLSSFLTCKMKFALKPLTFIVIKLKDDWYKVSNISPPSPESLYNDHSLISESQNCSCAIWKIRTLQQLQYFDHPLVTSRFYCIDKKQAWQ